MDLKTMKRKELQALCKKNGIPANSTNAQMIESLSSILQADEKVKPKGCLKGSGGSSGEDLGDSRGGPKKVSFVVIEDDDDEEPEEFARKPSAKSKGKSVVKRSSVDAKLGKSSKDTGTSSVVENLKVASEVSQRSTRSRRLSVAVLWSPVIEKKKKNILKDGTEGVRLNVEQISEKEDNIAEVPTRSLRSRVVVASGGEALATGQNRGRTVKRKCRDKKEETEKVVVLLDEKNLRKRPRDGSSAEDELPPKRASPSQGKLEETVDGGRSRKRRKGDSGVSVVEEGVVQEIEKPAGSGRAAKRLKVSSTALVLDYVVVTKPTRRSARRSSTVVEDETSLPVSKKSVKEIEVVTEAKSPKQVEVSALEGKRQEDETLFTVGQQSFKQGIAGQKGKPCRPAKNRGSRRRESTRTCSTLVEDVASFPAVVKPVKGNEAARKSGRPRKQAKGPAVGNAAESTTLAEETTRRPIRNSSKLLTDGDPLPSAQIFCGDSEGERKDNIGKQPKSCSLTYVESAVPLPDVGPVIESEKRATCSASKLLEKEVSPGVGELGYEDIGTDKKAKSGNPVTHSASNQGALTAFPPESEAASTSTKISARSSPVIGKLAGDTVGKEKSSSQVQSGTSKLGLLLPDNEGVSTRKSRATRSSAKHMTATKNTTGKQETSSALKAGDLSTLLSANKAAVTPARRSIQSPLKLVKEGTSHASGQGDLPALLSDSKGEPTPARRSTCSPLKLAKDVSSTLIDGNFGADGVIVNKGSEALTESGRRSTRSSSMQHLIEDDVAPLLHVESGDDNVEGQKNLSEENKRHCSPGNGAMDDSVPCSEGEKMYGQLELGLEFDRTAQLDGIPSQSDRNASCDSEHRSEILLSEGRNLGDEAEVIEGKEQSEEVDGESSVKAGDGASEVVTAHGEMQQLYVSPLTCRTVELLATNASGDSPQNYLEESNEGVIHHVSRDGLLGNEAPEVGSLPLFQKSPDLCMVHDTEGSPKIGPENPDPMVEFDGLHEDLMTSDEVSPEAYYNVVVGEPDSKVEVQDVSSSSSVKKNEAINCDELPLPCEYSGELSPTMINEASLVNQDDLHLKVDIHYLGKMASHGGSITAREDSDKGMEISTVQANDAGGLCLRRIFDFNMEGCKADSDAPSSAQLASEERSVLKESDETPGGNSDSYLYESGGEEALETSTPTTLPVKLNVYVETDGNRIDREKNVDEVSPSISVLPPGNRVYEHEVQLSEESLDLEDSVDIHGSEKHDAFESGGYEEATGPCSPTGSPAVGLEGHGKQSSPGVISHEVQLSEKKIDLEDSTDVFGSAKDDAVESGEHEDVTGLCSPSGSHALGLEEHGNQTSPGVIFDNATVDTHFSPQQSDSSQMSKGGDNDPVDAEVNSSDFFGDRLWKGKNNLFLSEAGFTVVDGATTVQPMEHKTNKDSPPKLAGMSREIAEGKLPVDSGSAIRLQDSSKPAKLTDKEDMEGARYLSEPHKDAVNVAGSLTADSLDKSPKSAPEIEIDPGIEQPNVVSDDLLEDTNTADVPSHSDSDRHLEQVEVVEEEMVHTNSLEGKISDENEDYTLIKIADSTVSDYIVHEFEVTQEPNQHFLLHETKDCSGEMLATDGASNSSIQYSVSKPSYGSLLPVENYPFSTFLANVQRATEKVDENAEHAAAEEESIGGEESEPISLFPLFEVQEGPESSSTIANETSSGRGLGLAERSGAGLTGISDISGLKSDEKEVEKKVESMLPCNAHVELKEQASPIASEEASDEFSAEISLIKSDSFYEATAISERLAEPSESGRKTSIMHADIFECKEAREAEISTFGGRDLVNKHEEETFSAKQSEDGSKFEGSVSKQAGWNEDATTPVSSVAKQNSAVIKWTEDSKTEVTDQVISKLSKVLVAAQDAEAVRTDSITSSRAYEIETTETEAHRMKFEDFWSASDDVDIGSSHHEFQESDSRFLPDFTQKDSAVYISPKSDDNVNKGSFSKQARLNEDATAPVSLVAKQDSAVIKWTEVSETEVTDQVISESCEVLVATQDTEAVRTNSITESRAYEIERTETEAHRMNFEDFWSASDDADIGSSHHEFQASDSQFFSDSTQKDSADYVSPKSDDNVNKEPDRSSELGNAQDEETVHKTPSVRIREPYSVIYDGTKNKENSVALKMSSVKPKEKSAMSKSTRRPLQSVRRIEDEC